MSAPARPESPIADVEPAAVWNPADPGQAQAAAADLPAQINARWRRWRVPLALIAFIVAGGVVIALIGRLISPSAPNGYLDPASQFGDGGHALADILGERGSQVVEVYSPSRALAALESGSASQGAGTPGPPVTLLITSPYLLTPGQQARLARSRADLFLVEPGPRALAALAPGVRVSGHAAEFGRVLDPRCNLEAARRAGSANVGGLTYLAPAHATGCYPVTGRRQSVVRYGAAGRTVTVIGSGAPLTNDLLDRHGNAALMLNLLARSRRIVWLTPEPTAVLVVGHHAEPGRAAPSLIPWAAWLLVIQLGDRPRAHRGVAQPPARTTDQRAAARGGQGVGDHRGARQALPVATRQAPGRRRAAARPCCPACFRPSGWLKTPRRTPSPPRWPPGRGTASPS